MSEPIDTKTALQRIASKLDIALSTGDRDELKNMGITERNLRSAKQISDTLQNASGTKQLATPCLHKCNEALRTLSRVANRRLVSEIHVNLNKFAAPKSKSKARK